MPRPQLDYDFWCGPAPWGPYSTDRTHWNWHWQMDYGGGQLMQVILSDLKAAGDSRTPKPGGVSRRFGVRASVLIAPAPEALLGSSAQVLLAEAGCSDRVGVDWVRSSAWKLMA